MDTKTTSYSNKPIVYISRDAYDKIKFYCNNATVEISGFGILDNSDESGKLKIIDFVTVKQESSSATTEMDDTAVADHLEDWVEAGFEPWQVMRAWVHTHPSGVTSPSSQDMETFEKCLGNGDFGIMIIFVKSGEIICNIHINHPVKVIAPAQLVIEPDPVQIEEWIKEAEQNVKQKSYIVTYNSYNSCYSRYNNSNGYEGIQSNRYNIQEDDNEIRLNELNKKSLADMTDEEATEYFMLQGGLS